MADWHCHAGGVQQGPLDEAALRAMARAGRLLPEDLVWRDGMPDWIEARQVPGLIVPAASTAPVPLSGVAPASGRPLDYRGAVVAASPAAPVQLFDDPGPFEKVGGQFRIQKTMWNGTVIASPAAFYLLKKGEARQTGVHMHFGLLGFLLAAAFSSEGDDLRTCTVAELPDRVRAAIDPKGKNAARDVAVLNRSAVRCLHGGKLTNALHVEIGDDNVRIVRSAFSGKKLKQFLTSNGWLFDEVCQPTEAPAYGMSMGRSAENPRPPAPTLLKRIAWVLLALLVLTIVVVIAIATQHSR